MATDYLVPDDIKAKYLVREWRNAAGILTTAWPEQWNDLLEVLRGFRLMRSEIVVGGGGGCPVLTFAITQGLYEDDGDFAVEQLKRRIAAAKAARKKKGTGLSAGEAELADLEDDADG
jgi:hypothetical protein